MVSHRFFPRVLAAVLVATGTAQASEIWLTLDQPRRESFETAIGQIVVGNPAIADVSVQSNTEVLLFGKMPGLTTITYIDTAGNPFRRSTVRVRTASDRMVTLHAGGTRYTFSCTDVCEQTATVGDGDNASRVESGTVSGQAQARIDAASETGNGPASQSRTRASGFQTPDGIDPQASSPEG